MTGPIKRLMQKLGRKTLPEQPCKPAIENPYRRFYSQDRSFEELVRKAKKDSSKKQNTEL